MLKMRKVSRWKWLLLISATPAIFILGIPWLQTRIPWLQSSNPAADAVRPRECVILLHGLGRGALSMAAIGAGLRCNGFAVVNLDYASTRKSLEALAEEDLAPAVAECRTRDYDRIHLVSHSMGGIIARVFLRHHTLPPGSRVVMLSPPNQGSEVADWAIHHLPRLYHLAGPAAGQLGTGDDSISRSAAPLTAQIGIIAGNRSWNPIFSAILPGDDDGKVSVSRTRLAGMADFLIVPRTHLTILYDRAVIGQIAYFLANGGFARH
jgi:triacylglycerol lipase